MLPGWLPEAEEISVLIINSLISTGILCQINKPLNAVVFETWK